MTYQLLTPLKVKTPEGIRELQAGEVIALPEDMALQLMEGGRIKPFSPDCFSPDGTLEAAFREAVADGWTDYQLLEHIDALREAGALEAPWGFKVKGSPLMGDWWIISDTTARGRIPVGDFSFTLDELRPIVETCRVFPGAKVQRVIRPKARRASNG